MNNENNGGIIIEGGITEITFNEKGMFPVTVPIEEIKIEGGAKSRKPNKYTIPTMSGLWIMVGNSEGMKHGPRIKVSRKKADFRNHNDYNSYNLNNEEMQIKKGKNSGITKKDEIEIKSFLERNIDDIILNSNSTKKSERIDDSELYERIYRREVELYKERKNENG